MMGTYYISGKKIGMSEFKPIDFHKNRFVNSVADCSVYVNKTIHMMVEIVEFLRMNRPGIEFKINKLD